MTDPTRATTDPTDAEVERLADIARDAYIAAVDRRDSGNVYRDAARAVLADIDARWIRVPREGAEVQTQYGQDWRGQLMPLHGASPVLGTETHPSDRRHRPVAGGRVSAYPPEAVEAAAEIIAADRREHASYSAETAVAVLDAVIAAGPALTWHTDGTIGLDWPTEPAVGALVVVPADLIRRLVEKVNELNEQNREIRKQVADKIEEALGYSPLREWVKNRS